MPTQAVIVRSQALGMLKCPRCAKWTYTLNYSNLCNRCVDVLLFHHKEHESIPFILDNLNLRGLKPEDNPERK